jgi:RHS repeat-associated protein
VTSTTNGAGAVSGRYGYSAHGAIASHSGTDSPYAFAGRPYDSAAGPYDYRDRWYDPSVGRFISEDLVESSNRYAYANGAPTAFSDPSGMIAMSELVETWQFQAALGTSFSTIQALTKCDASFGSVAKAAGIGLVSSVGGGFVARKLFKAFGPFSNAEASAAQLYTNAVISRFMAEALGASTTTAIAKILDGDSPFEDPVEFLTQMITAGVVGGTSPGSSNPAVHGVGGAGVVEVAGAIGRALPGGPESQCT